MMQAVRRTRPISNGMKWIEKPLQPLRNEVKLCITCGNKYLKTRDRQRVCIRCIVIAEKAKPKI